MMLFRSQRRMNKKINSVKISFINTSASFIELLFKLQVVLEFCPCISFLLAAWKEVQLCQKSALNKYTNSLKQLNSEYMKCPQSVFLMKKETLRVIILPARG